MNITDSPYMLQAMHAEHLHQRHDISTDIKALSLKRQEVISSINIFNGLHKD
jgi:hypothetical protein